MDGMETVEVLRRAKALIDSPEKWWKKVEQQPAAEGSNCALTALIQVAWQRGAHHSAEDALGEVLGMNDPSHDIPVWNDAPERTHAEVMAAFDKAIAAEEAKAQPTPAADETLSIMAACDAAAELVADAVIRQEPDYHRPTVVEVASAELFLCSQDVARYFPPITQSERDEFAEAIRAELGA